MKKVFDDILQQLSEKYNENILLKDSVQIYGGDINSAFKLYTTAGSFFLKLNSESYNDMFVKEAEGLELLDSAKTIKIPQPILYGRSETNIFLVMESFIKGRIGKNFWQEFAYGLAGIHQQTVSFFGLDTNNYCGSLLQSNKKHDNWCSFYTEERIMPLIQKAYTQKRCTLDEIKLAEKVCAKFESLMPAEKSSLVHGDLWCGNFLSTREGKVVIYDPAVYYGHREMDIAMTELFGGFDERFYDYYNEAFPLQPQWQERIQLFQLYPLLVHVVLFGEPYYNKVISILKKYA
ncbi:MAG: fructosamine kinase family protein [Ilyomonas sp.]